MKNRDRLKPWLCQGKHGHVLGQMRRTGRGNMILLLYAEAIDPALPGDQPPEVRAVLYGPALNVRCSICQATRAWTEKRRSDGSEKVN
jgi:hypothetical protein